MISIYTYITEKLKLNSNISIKFDPDDMSGKEIITIYNDEEEDMDDTSYLEDIRERINKEYEGFICFRNEISESKNLDNDFIQLSDDLFIIFRKVITSHDNGYIVNLSKGRIEIISLNSGSRAHFYIYALTKEGFNSMEDWVNNKTDDKSIFYNREFFEQIDDKLLIL